MPNDNINSQHMMKAEKSFNFKISSFHSLEGILYQPCELTRNTTVVALHKIKLKSKKEWGACEGGDSGGEGQGSEAGIWAPERSRLMGSGARESSSWKEREAARARHGLEQAAFQR